ncbi:MAG TPA: VTT domain-containing protein [bacterium]|nr:VTT domain-containing protein [bacterium]
MILAAAIPYLIMLIIGFTGSAFWFPNCEISLLAMANVEHVPEFKFLAWQINLANYEAGMLWLLGLMTAVGSTFGSGFLYFMGRGALKVSKKVQAKIEKVDITKFEKLGAAVLFTSSVSSIPPLTPLSFAAGIIKYDMLEYFLVTFAGKLIRFLIVVYASEGMVNFILGLKLF